MYQGNSARTAGEGNEKAPRWGGAVYYGLHFKAKLQAGSGYSFFANLNGYSLSN